MDQRPLIEIRDWGQRPRRVALNGPVVVGRDCAGEVLRDVEVSREHLRIVPTPTALSVVDLGSSNGSTLNGVALSGRAALSAGDVIRLGRSEIIVLSIPAARGSEQPRLPEPDVDATRMNMRAIVVPPPPPVPSEAKPSSPAVALAERVLGIDPTGERELFPAYTELPTKVPLRVWQAIRLGSVIGYFALLVTLFVRPQTGLFVFFGIIVPLLPVLFLTAPGLWRNICPMAATNQVPRLFGFSRALDPPDWLRNRGYLIAMALFFGIAGARIAGLDNSGVATGIVLTLVIVVAFVGGYVFKGKSGWCSSICPLFPMQRAYGQTPYVTVPNSHCPTCVGCAKNCYDFKPPRRVPSRHCRSRPRLGRCTQAVRRRAARVHPRLLHAPRGHRHAHAGALPVAVVVRSRQRRGVFRHRCRLAAEFGDGCGHLCSGGTEHLLLVRRTGPRRLVRIPAPASTSPGSGGSSAP